MVSEELLEVDIKEKVVEFIPETPEEFCNRVREEFANRALQRNKIN